MIRGPQFPQAMPQAVAETLGYLLVQICKAHRNRTQELLGQMNLYTGQELLLMRLAMNDGMTQSELAEELCVQPATLTRSLDRLSKANLVERRIDTEDQRVSRVYLTETGRALRQPIEQVWQTMDALSFANLTTEERVLLRRLLLQVYANLQQ
jgi:MarR family transcriptional regulator, organic hydroperoxide resistance regulator